jgi:NAD(P)H dehydrogenase (quinone)
VSTLVVTAHPDPDSLTHHAADRLAQLVGVEDVALAHLAQEGFDPRSTAQDRQAYLGRGRPADDVLAEQRRLDAAQHLVLVFPVQWWSVPALLKGWVDRVFIAGWAFGYDAEGRVEPRLQDLTTHLLPLAGTSAASFARHGYRAAFRTQLEVGVVDFCGMGRGATAFVHDAESGDRAALARSVDDAAGRIVAAITHPRLR